ncbi:MAG: hypothetical protein Q9188_005139 [Gyalolechia gomerana]
MSPVVVKRNGTNKQNTSASGNDPFSSNSKRKRPGRPRSPTKSTAMPRKNHQSTVTSELPTAHRNAPPTATTTTITAPTSSTSSSLSTSPLPTTTRLQDFRSYLRHSDPSTDPEFRTRFQKIDAFVADLARSREMFDVGLYNDVRSMLRVHGERMLEEEEDALEEERRGRVEEEEEGEREEEEEEDEEEGPTGKEEEGERGVVTYKVPSWSTTDSGIGRVVTYKVPSWSTTESSGRSGILTGGIFSRKGGGEDMDPSSQNLHYPQGKNLQGDSGLDEALEDANPLQFSRSLLQKAERDMRPPVDELPVSPNNGSKRPFVETIDSEYANKRAKMGGMMAGPTSAEIRFIEGKPYIPLEEHEFGDLNEVEEEEDEEEGEEGQSEGEEEEYAERDGAPPACQEEVRKHNLIGDTRKLGSGSLIPPEIASFEVDEGRLLRSQAATEKNTGSVKDDREIDTQFWPGDPVFMFGETKFLQAVKSRQIEKDLAPNDEKVQSEIDRRPLFGMFARFELPTVSKGDEEKPSMLEL